MKQPTIAMLLLAGMTGLVPAISTSASLAAQGTRAGQLGDPGIHREGPGGPGGPGILKVPKDGEVKNGLTRGPNGEPLTGGPPHPAVLDPKHLVTRQKLTGWAKELSNWGRWGPVDQRGALNLITPQKAIEASRLVREGVTATLHVDVGNANYAPDVDMWKVYPAIRRPASHSPEGQPSSIEALTYGLHDGVSTHMNSLCHYPGGANDPSGPAREGEPQVSWNGFPAVVTEYGCQDNDIVGMGTTYVTRGVLYDIPLLKKVPYLPPHTPIFTEDLEEFERMSGAKVGAGDVLILRTGRWALREKEGAWDTASMSAGFHASVLPWLKQRDISVLMTDGHGSVIPSGVEGIRSALDVFLVTVMGVPLIDNGYPEHVAQKAQEFKRWEFMVAWDLMRIPGGTASSLTALAAF